MSITIHIDNLIISGGYDKTPVSDLHYVSDLYWSLVQTRLNVHGYEVDATGVWDDATDKQVRAFKAANGLRDDRTLIGPLTLEKLAATPAETPPVATPSDVANKWMKTAYDELGVKEVPGSGDNPRIVEYHGATDMGKSPDSVPWCGSFVAWVLRESGVPYSRKGKAAARSWLKEGTELDGPAYGAIVVFWRGSPDSWQGHTGFIAGKDEAGRLMVISGNVSNAVTIDPFTLDRVLGYRWPKEQPVPIEVGMDTLDVIDSKGKPPSTDEA